MPSGEVIKNITKGGSQGVWGIFTSIFHKLGFKWSFTLILIFIIFGSAIFTAIEERNPVLIITEVGGRIILSDNTLETATKEIITNPQVAEMDESYRQYDSTLSSYQKVIVYPVNFIVNGYLKVKYFFQRISVFFNLLANIWFLYMMTYLLMLAAMKVIIQDDSKSTAAWVMAIVLMILFQMVFSALTYDVDANYNDLTMKQKIEKITPFRGTMYMLSHLGDLFRAAENRIVDNVHPFDINQSLNITNPEVVL